MNYSNPGKVLKSPLIGHLRNLNLRRGSSKGINKGTTKVATGVAVRVATKVPSQAQKNIIYCNWLKKKLILTSHKFSIPFYHMKNTS